MATDTAKVKEWRAAWRQTEAGRASKRDRTKRWKLRNLAKIAEIKTSRGCVDCGYNSHHAALDFDHRDPTLKAHNVSDMVRRMSMERILKEVEKCDVVCANCHRIRTHEASHYTLESRSRVG